MVVFARFGRNASARVLKSEATGWCSMQADDSTQVIRFGVFNAVCEMAEMEVPMKVVAMALVILNAGTLFSLQGHGQTGAGDRPKFQIDIQTAGEGSPKFRVTNLTGKTVTAYVVRLSSSSGSEGQSQTLWDALVQNVPAIEPGGSISQNLGHRVGGPPPDRLEVVAGAWADGETFGDPELVKTIVKNRETTAAGYEQAIAMLQRGLDENWNRDQYVQALSDKPNSSVFYGIRSTIAANTKFDKQPQQSRRALQVMLASLTRELDLLKKAKPVGSR
jgi:hypothetical protein